MIAVSEKGYAALIGEEDWNQISETVYVLFDPDTLPALLEARSTPTSELETIDRKNIF